MDIREMSKEDIIEVGAKALLKDGTMEEGELFEALVQFNGMCTTASIVQMVVNGQLDMHWRDGKLTFGLKEGDGSRNS